MNTNYKEVLATSNPDWKSEAEQLARDGIAFVVVGFKWIPPNLELCESLRTSYGVESKYQPETLRAFFEKGTKLNRES